MVQLQDEAQLYEDKSLLMLKVSRNIGDCWTSSPELGIRPEGIYKQNLGFVNAPTPALCVILLLPYFVRGSIAHLKRLK